MSETFDLASDLKDRFDFAAIFYLSSWEYEPNGMLDDHTTRDLTDGEQTIVRIFEGLAATVPVKSSSNIIETEALISTVGPEKYDACMAAAFQNVGRTSFPSTASEFLDDLNICLRATIKAGK